MVVEELDLPPIEPVRLEDVDEDLTHYQCEDKSLYSEYIKVVLLFGGFQKCFL